MSVKLTDSSSRIDVKQPDWCFDNPCNKNRRNNKIIIDWKMTKNQLKSYAFNQFSIKNNLKTKKIC